MQRLIPGAKIQILSTESDWLWFLPAQCDIVETIGSLRGRVLRCRLNKAIPLRNTEISQIVLLVDSNFECDVYLGLSESLNMDPILHLGKARVA